MRARINSLSADKRQAIDELIIKELDRHLHSVELNLLAIFLWTAYQTLDLEPNQVWKLQDAIYEAPALLESYYEMTDEAPFIAEQLLAQKGIKLDTQRRVLGSRFRKNGKRIR